MSNFGYLKNENSLSALAGDCIKAESLFPIDENFCLIQCRRALDTIVRWVYQQEGWSYQERELNELVFAESFRQLVEAKVWSLLPFMLQAGTRAAQVQSTTQRAEALTALKGLFDLVQWLEGRYLGKSALQSFDQEKIAQPDSEKQEEGKLFSHASTLDSGNFIRNNYEDGTVNAISTKKTLNTMVHSGLTALWLEDAVTAKWQIQSTEKVSPQQMPLNQNSAQASSYFELAEDYRLGRGQEVNIALALEYYYRAAEQGLAEAQNSLGNCYYYGRATRQSYQEAAKWYHRAAEQGLAEAQDKLGDCYYYGKGVDQGYEAAVRWYQRAAKQGYARAQNKLGNSYYYGQGVEQNHQEAAKWYLQAAEQGYARAQNKLGSFYYHGQGVAKSYKEAAKWYGKSAAQGNSTGIFGKNKCDEALARQKAASRKKKGSFWQQFFHLPGKR